MIHRLRALWVVSMMMLAFAHPAFAQDEAARAQAREQFALGVSRYQSGEYSSALEAFQEAYRLAPHPSVRVNMANCYERLSRPIEALHHFERFLAEAQNPSRAQRTEVQGAIQRLARQVGELRFAIVPDGATVIIDSSETRRTPILEPIRVTAGAHSVEVRMEGFRTERRSIEVAGGQSERISIRLERGSDPVAAVSEPPPEQTAATSESPPPEAAVAEAPSETDAGSEGGFELRLTTGVVVGGSIALAFTLAAVISGSYAIVANNDFEGAVVRSNDPSLSRGERNLAREEGLRAADGARTASVLTDIFIVGAIAAAGVCTFFLIVDGMNPEAESLASAGGVRLAAAPSIGRDGGGLVLSGSFF